MNIFFKDTVDIIIQLAEFTTKEVVKKKDYSEIVSYVSDLTNASRDIQELRTLLFKENKHNTEIISILNYKISDKLYTIEYTFKNISSNIIRLLVFLKDDATLSFDRLLPTSQDDQCYLIESLEKTFEIIEKYNPGDLTKSEKKLLPRLKSLINEVTIVVPKINQINDSFFTIKFMKSSQIREKLSDLHAYFKLICDVVYKFGQFLCPRFSKRFDQNKQKSQFSLSEVLKETIDSLKLHDTQTRRNKINTTEQEYLVMLADEIEKNIVAANNLNANLAKHSNLDNEKIEALLLNLFKQYASIQWNLEYISQYSLELYRYYDDIQNHN